MNVTFSPCSSGYRCFKTVLFLSGLAFGSAVGHLLCVQERLLDGRTQAGVSLGVGLLAALVAVLVRSVGLFLTGLQLGALLSGAALLLLGQYYPVFSAAWVPVGVVIGTSVFFAVITLCWRKAMMVAATAVVGAAVTTACVGYWVEMPVLVLRAFAGVKRQQGLCWYSWAVIGIWPVLAALGMLVQWRITAHADGISSHHKQTTENTRRSHFTPTYIYIQTERENTAHFSFHLYCQKYSCSCFGVKYDLHVFFTAFQNTYTNYKKKNKDKCRVSVGLKNS